MIVIDNLRAAVKQPDWYDPELNPRLEAFCQHYGIVILPTKSYTPRHKGKIERGISYEYEKPLISPKDSRDFRLPDFTVGFQGDIYFWEHLGMLNVPAYRDAWEKKLAWYKTTGFFDQLITSRDAPNGGIDATEIEQIARSRVLR